MFEISRLSRSRRDLDCVVQLTRCFGDEDIQVGLSDSNKRLSWGSWASAFSWTSFSRRNDFTITIISTTRERDGNRASYLRLFGTGRWSPGRWGRITFHADQRRPAWRTCPEKLLIPMVYHFMHIQRVEWSYICLDFQIVGVGNLRLGVFLIPLDGSLPSSHGAKFKSSLLKCIILEYLWIRF